MALTRPWIGFVLDGVLGGGIENLAFVSFQSGGLGIIHPFPEVSPSLRQPN